MVVDPGVLTSALSSDCRENTGLSPVNHLLTISMQTLMKMILPVFHCVLFLLFFSQSQAAERTLLTADYFKLANMSDVQISPNGEQIVFGLNTVNVMEDRHQSALWIMDADGERRRPFLEKASGLIWSPDSGRTAYLKTVGDSSEIFIRDMQSGKERQLTGQGIKPHKLSWSPDGRWIAFLGSVPAVQNWKINLDERPEQANWVGDAVVIDRLHYRLDAKMAGTVPYGLTDRDYLHIFVVSVDGGEVRQLTQGEWNAELRWSGNTRYFSGPPQWTPDSRALVFSGDAHAGSADEYAHANLYRVSVDDRRLVALTKGKGFWGFGFQTGLKVSPDGNSVAYIGMAAPESANVAPMELKVLDIKSGKSRTLIADLADLGGLTFLHWQKNGKGVFFANARHGSNNIYRVSLAGEVSEVTSGPQSIVVNSVSNNQVAAGTYTSTYKAPEIIRIPLGGGDPQVITDINSRWLQEIRLGKVETVWYSSKDGTKVQGWLMYPPGFDPQKKYPLMLAIHGGPEYMFTGDFNFPFQDMAAQGYVVLFVNPRGSTGYGGDFVRAIYNAYPGRADYEDLMSGVDAAIGKGFVDESRMYVQGCSGGGILTAWVVTQTDRFAAASANCAVVNRISGAGSADMPGAFYNQFKKPFWEDPFAWLATSSIMHVDKVATPTLVMVGEHDVRTPVAQSEEFYTALKMLGVPTRLVLIQEEGHGFTPTTHPSNMLRTQRYMRLWFSQWTKMSE